MRSDLQSGSPGGGFALPLRLLLLITLGAVVLACAIAAPARASTGGATPSQVGATGGPSPIPPPQTPHGTPFGERGMWIWYVSKSQGGNVAAIIAKAQAYGVRTVFIKSSDGDNRWSQFTPQLVSQLRAGGLNVCAWQYVYGNDPVGEAQLGAGAKNLGAQCLVVDAETEYEGRYYQAQTYMKALRKQVGRTWPIGLAGFPYVDYHPAFPYSVFFGPGGVQVNMPQMYWKAIGTTVDRVYQHTYIDNPLYRRAIAPLGQTYDATHGRDIVRFRELANANGALGVSYWDWQEASGSNWKALASPLPLQFAAATPSTPPVLSRGGKGDVIVWAQEHLVGAGYTLRVTGVIDSATVAAINSFRASLGLAQTGQIDASVWPALLRKPAKMPTYAPPRPAHSRARAASVPAGYAPIPLSASMPAVRNELARAPR